MGADFYQAKEKCPTCGHEEDYDSISITYNLSPMWYAMFPGDKTMLPIDGLTGQEAQEKLDEAIYKMVRDEEKLQCLNPSNGFGSFDGFLDSLRKMLHLSQNNPDLKWGVWR